MSIRSRKHSHTDSRNVQPLLTQSLLALATLGLPLAAQAQAQASAEKTLHEVSVKAAAEQPYKVEKASSPKLTQPLVDTTQTIAVIRKELIQEQGAVSVMEALRNTPGITLQLGENGSTSAGDTFQMRGFSAQSSVFVDGVRDLGAVTRDAFNIEQIEVSKGPAGADIGRGAASGYVNLVSKTPVLDNINSAGLSIDSAASKRVSADLNRQIGAGAAFRLNLMVQDGDVLGRDVLHNRNRGIAPSISFGLGSPTRLSLFSQHVRQDKTPDGGIPGVGLEGFNYVNSPLAKASRVDRNNYYGSRSDYQKVDADMITGKIEHDLAPGTTISNIARYGKSKMDRVLTGINGVTVTEAGPKGTVVAAPPERWVIARSRQSVLQENEILSNQTNVVSAFQTGAIAHTVSGGLEISSEKQLSSNRSGLGTMAAANLYHPNPDDVVSALNPQLNGAYTDGNTTTLAAYLFDTLKLSEQWQVNGGLRYEHYNTESTAVALSTAAANPTLPVNTLLPTTLSKSDRLLSWKAGLLYKPADNGSIYAAYSTSQTPPGSANFSLSASAGNLNGPSMEPQKTSNIELGSKWDVLAKQLALTAALYRTENKNEIALLDVATNTYSQLGKRRVQGVELGAVGQITPAWNVTAGLATMHASIIEGTTGNNATGAATRWSPKLSATLWSSYKVDSQWTVAGGARYMSEQKRLIDPNLDPATQNNLPAIPSYAVADAMFSYKASKQVTVQLNVYNLFNKYYIETLNNSGARATLGNERSATLSASIVF